MKRRTLLQWLASSAASWPLMRADLSALDLATAQELQPDQIFVLHDVAATVLPSAIGRQGQDDAVGNFLKWLREYKEGVALSHGYGEPRLVKRLGGLRRPDGDLLADLGAGGARPFTRRLSIASRPDRTLRL